MPKKIQRKSVAKLTDKVNVSANRLIFAVDIKNIGMKKKLFKYNWQYLVKTVVEVVRDSIGLYSSIANDDIQWLLIYLLVISVRLYLIVTLLYAYWELHKLENEVNFMEYFKESFKEQIIRHHICYK